jgi:predicted metalloenzyme YecM
VILVTPRNVLREMMRSSKMQPWWLRLSKEIVQHLSDATVNGRAIIDLPMSEAAVEAVLEEAVDVVTKPKLILPGLH